MALLNGGKSMSVWGDIISLNGSLCQSELQAVGAEWAKGLREDWPTTRLDLRPNPGYNQDRSKNNPGYNQARSKAKSMLQPGQT